MTRAATSSVKQKLVSYGFEADEDSDGWRRRWRVTWDEAEGEREEVERGCLPSMAAVV